MESEPASRSSAARSAQASRAAGPPESQHPALYSMWKCSANSSTGNSAAVSVKFAYDFALIRKEKKNSRDHHTSELSYVQVASCVPPSSCVMQGLATEFKRKIGR